MSDLRPDHAADAAFIDRIAPALQEPVSVGTSFDDRVMAAVRAESRRSLLREGRAGWWRRSRRFSLSPAGGLALAAGFAGIVALATLAVVGAARGTLMLSARAGTADTVHLVRFVFVDHRASQVAVAGDFNGWSRTASPMSRTGVDGVWAVSLPVARGRHEYAFVVDSTRWSADPTARAHADEHGTESSLLSVGER